MNKNVYFSVFLSKNAKILNTMKKREKKYLKDSAEDKKRHKIQSHLHKLALLKFKFGTKK